jgi:hypothetical protein
MMLFVFKRPERIIMSTHVLGCLIKPIPRYGAGYSHRSGTYEAHIYTDRPGSREHEAEK